MGANLAEFDTAQEESLIDLYLNRDTIFWIGLTDMALEGTWRWAETHKTPEYQNWAGDAPNGGTIENCACKILHTNAVLGQWEDTHCDREFVNAYGYHALCQASK